jgi:nitroimidazol reductase NimA-like FMN-containing flavoprotein (pyridoxamine 5'-phosphate oxidase superfamily)
MARKDITMTKDEMAAFLDGSHILQVSSIDNDGYPHIAPMWYFVDDGNIVFRSFTKSQKIVNLERNNKLGVLVEAGDAYSELRGVMIRGTARFVTDPAYILKVYGELAARYAMLGEAPQRLTPEELDAAFGRFATKNTAVVVEPEKIASWDHRKLGGVY